jgi:RHS repeat-associated protein
MAQQKVRTRTPAHQEVGKSRGHWNRDAHFLHRDYSPTLGRFIERDPIGFEAGDNNWYPFVANGPTGELDPSGLQCQSRYPATEVDLEEMARLAGNHASVGEDIMEKVVKRLTKIPGIGPMKNPALWTAAGLTAALARMPMQLARSAILGSGSDNRRLHKLIANHDGHMFGDTSIGGFNERIELVNSDKPVVFTCAGTAMGCWKEVELAKNLCDLYDEMYEAYQVLVVLEDFRRNPPGQTVPSPKPQPPPASLPPTIFGPVMPEPPWFGPGRPPETA